MSTSKKRRAELTVSHSRKTVCVVFAELKKNWRLKNASERSKPMEVATVSTAPSDRTDVKAALS
jgi:hypothetical protein